MCFAPQTLQTLQVLETRLESRLLKKVEPHILKCVPGIDDDLVSFDVLRQRLDEGWHRKFVEGCVRDGAYFPAACARP